MTAHKAERTQNMKHKTQNTEYRLSGKIFWSSHYACNIHLKNMAAGKWTHKAERQNRTQNTKHRTQIGVSRANLSDPANTPATYSWNTANGTHKQKEWNTEHRIQFLDQIFEKILANMKICTTLKLELCQRCTHCAQAWSQKLCACNEKSRQWQTKPSSNRWRRYYH